MKIWADAHYLCRVAVLRDDTNDVVSRSVDQYQTNRSPLGLPHGGLLYSALSICSQSGEQHRRESGCTVIGILGSAANLGTAQFLAQVVR